MTLDADHYRINVQPIADLTREKTEAERIQMLGVLAISTGVPIIICCVYLGELYGFSEELVKTMERFKTFYHITEVKGIKNEKTIHSSGDSSITGVS